MRASRMKEQAQHEWRYLSPSQTSNIGGVWQRGDGARTKRRLDKSGWIAFEPNGSAIKQEPRYPGHRFIPAPPARTFRSARAAMAYLDREHPTAQAEAA